MYFALADWRLDTDGPPTWRGPAGCRLALDLRGLPNTTAASPVGRGIFAFDTDPSGLPGVRVLGDDPDGVLPGAVLTALRGRLGVQLSATRLKPVLVELLTTHGDPTQAARWGALRPTRRGNELRFVFGTIRHREPFDLASHPHAAKVIAAERQAYINARTQALAVGDPRHRKFLGALVTRKYPGVDYRLFQSGLPDEEPIPPETTVTDDFAYSDGDLDSVAGSNWTEVAGDTDILSNTASFQTISGATGAQCRNDNALSSDDHYAEATLSTLDQHPSTNNNGGPCCRFNASSAIFYLGTLENHASGDDHVHLYRYNAGFTSLATAVVTLSIPDTIRLTLDANDYTAAFNGSDVIGPTTDASPITGNVNFGMFGYINSGDTAGSVAISSITGADSAAEAALIARFARRRGRRMRARKAFA